MKFKNKLERLLAEAYLENGVNRTVKLRAVMDYIDTLSGDQFSDEVKVIRNNSLLQMLVACGVRREVMSIFLQTYAKNIVGSV